MPETTNPAVPVPQAERLLISDEVERQLRVVFQVAPPAVMPPKLPAANGAKFILPVGIVLIIAGLAGYRMYKDHKGKKVVVEGKAEIGADGQSVIIKTGLIRKKTIRLAHLSVPAARVRPAKWYLEDQIKGQTVKVEMDGDDGVLYVTAGNVNYAMVRYGLAQCTDDTWKKAEDKAKKAALGMWAAPTSSEAVPRAPDVCLLSRPKIVEKR